MFIPPGWNLVIDVNTPKLAELWIDGGNVTMPARGCVIHTGLLVIRNRGALTAGSEAAPFAGSLFILLHGQRDSEVKAWSEDVVMGAKALAVVEGELALHGKPRARHVPLALDATAGTDSLTLAADPVGWEIGDAVAVTSTDFNPDGEEFKVAAISGRSVTLNAPLARAHTARRWQDPRGTHDVDLRARVINLASNIVIAADDGADTWAGGALDKGAKFGAHVLVADAGRAQLSNVAVRYCGQFGEERGCVKFHATADPARRKAGSFLRNSATSYGAPLLADLQIAHVP